MSLVVGYSTNVDALTANLGHDIVRAGAHPEDASLYPKRCVLADLALTMACGPYDRTEALRYGKVQPEGINLTYLAIQDPPEIFARMLQHKAFDLAEMSCSHYLTRRTTGDFPFIALPVFPSKLFRHGFIFVNSVAGINTPKDLEGKRVGFPSIGQTAVVWIRGILQSEYGVCLDRIHWYQGGMDTPGYQNPIDHQTEKIVSLALISDSQTLSSMLESGELDAVIGARAPSCFGKNDRVQRLFPNYRQVEQDYYRQTGVSPIMHTMVINEELHQARPWVAQSIYKAMEEAKRLCLEEMQFTGAMRYMLPWLYHDLDEISGVFGAEDPWPYGVEANRTTLSALQRYLAEQGFIKEVLPLEELFAPILFGGI